MSPKELCSSVLERANMTVAFMSRRSFVVMQELPFSLATGNIRDNLHKFASGPPPKNKVVWKIYQLLRSKAVSFEVIVEGVELWLDIHFSTLFSEQGHGKAAVIRKYHPTLFANAIACWTFLLMFIPLIRPVRKDPREVAILKAMNALEKKRPRQLHAENLFLADSIKQTQAQLHDRPASAQKRARCQVVATHVQTFKILDEETKLSYKRDAKLEVRRQENVIADALGGLEEALARLRSQQEKAAATRGVRGLVEDMLLSETDKQVLQCMYEDPKYTHKHVEDIRSNYQKPPGEWTIEDFAPYERHHVDACDGEDLSQRPPWVGAVCRNRDTFRNTLFVIGEPPEVPRYLQFIIAKQHPYIATWLQLAHRPTSIVYKTDEAGRRVIDEENTHRHSFITTGPHVQEYELMHTNVSKMKILTGVVPTANGFWVSNSLRFLDMQEFLKSLPVHAEAPADTVLPPKDKNLLPKHVAEKFPFLNITPTKPEVHIRDKPIDKSQIYDYELSDDEKEELDPVELKALYSEAVKRRLRIMDITDFGIKREDFVLEMRESKKNTKRGKDVLDVIRGKAKGELATYWCDAYNMHHSISLTISTYGELSCVEMAEVWCHRLQVLFDLWIEKGGDLDVVHTKEDHTNVDKLTGDDFVKIEGLPIPHLAKRILTINSARHERARGH